MVVFKVKKLWSFKCIRDAEGLYDDTQGKMCWPSSALCKLVEFFFAFSAPLRFNVFTAESAEDAEIESYTFTPKRYPTNAERTIAMVPQIRMRTTAFIILDPPVLAETAPNITSDKMVNPYRKYSI